MPRGQRHQLLHQIRPVARAAQVINHHHLGVAQHVIHVEIGGRGLAQPHQVGQPHLWKCLWQSSSGIGQQRQGGVSRAQHHDVAGRLLNTHDALPAVFDETAWPRGQQMHVSWPQAAVASANKADCSSACRAAASRWSPINTSRVARNSPPCQGRSKWLSKRCPTP